MEDKKRETQEAEPKKREIRDVGMTLRDTVEIDLRFLTGESE